MGYQVVIHCTAVNYIKRLAINNELICGGKHRELAKGNNCQIVEINSQFSRFGGIKPCIMAMFGSKSLDQRR